MKTEIVKRGRLLLPGLYGMGINIVLLLVGLAVRRSLSGFFALTFFFSPIVVTLCIGALVEGVREFVRTGVIAREAKVTRMRVLDMVVGLLGMLPFVFRALAYQSAFFGLNEIVPHVLILLFMCALGYIFLSWMILGGRTRTLLGVLVWIPYAAVSFFLALDTFFWIRDGSVTRDTAINDLNNIGTQAYQYRIRPNSMNGGNGSYVGFVILSNRASNANGTYRAKVLSSDTVVFRCMYADSSGIIIAKLNADGKLFDWKYYGSAKQEGDADWLIWIKNLVGE